MERKKEIILNPLQETPRDDNYKTVVNSKPAEYSLRERELALREQSNKELEIALKKLEQEFKGENKIKSEKITDIEGVGLVGFDEQQLEGLSLDYMESELEKCLEIYDNFEKSIIKDGRYESVKRAIMPSSHSEGQDIYDANTLSKLDKKISQLSGEIRRRRENSNTP